jgi:serine/threonine protein phosphatase PrpC
LELQLIDVRDDDVYLLCTDGLDKEVDDAAIATILRSGDCRTNAQVLIEAALENGARDNVTVVVVRAVS